MPFHIRLGKVLKHLEEEGWRSLTRATIIRFHEATKLAGPSFQMRRDTSFAEVLQLMVPQDCISELIEGMNEHLEVQRESVKSYSLRCRYRAATLSEFYLLLATYCVAMHDKLETVAELYLHLDEEGQSVNGPRRKWFMPEYRFIALSGAFGHTPRLADLFAMFSQAFRAAWLFDAQSVTVIDHVGLVQETVPERV